MITFKNFSKGVIQEGSIYFIHKPAAVGALVKVEPGGWLRAGNNISPHFHDNRSDPRSQKGLKLDDHVLHLQDGQDGGGGGHRHGPQGVIS